MYDVCLTSTGDLMAVGYTESYVNDGKRDALIIKFDKNLNIILNKTVSVGYDETLLRLHQHDDYIFAIGWIEKPISPSGMILRMNLNGSDIRMKIFENSTFFDLDIVGDKLFIAGITGYNEDNIDMQIVVMDKDLNVLETWTWGAAECNETIHSIVCLGDMIYIAWSMKMRSNKTAFVSAFSITEKKFVWNTTIHTGDETIILWNIETYRDRIFISILQEELWDTYPVGWLSRIVCLDSQGRKIWNISLDYADETNAFGMYIDSFGIIHIAGELLDLYPLSTNILRKNISGWRIIIRRFIQSFYRPNRYHW